MKKLVLIFLTCLVVNINAQTPQESFKILSQRVNSQGVTPPQERYNLYTDKINGFFRSNEWTGDAIVSIKEIKQLPVSDPTDWYYFVSVKTKKCSQPIYISYDIGDSNIGVVFQVETSFLPTEIKNHIDGQVRLVLEARAKEDSITKAREANENIEYQKTIQKEKQYYEKWDEYDLVRKEEVKAYIDDTIKPLFKQKIRASADAFLLTLNKDTADIIRENISILYNFITETQAYVNTTNIFVDYPTKKMTNDSQPFRNSTENAEESINKYRVAYKAFFNRQVNDYITIDLPFTLDRFIELIREE